MMKPFAGGGWWVGGYQEERVGGIGTWNIK